VTTTRTARRAAGLAPAAGHARGGLVGCGGGEVATSVEGATAAQTQEGQEPQGAVPDGPAEIDVQSVVGQTITVRAEINEVLTESVFSFGDAVFGDSVLVLTAKPVVDQLDENGPVEVTGTVREAFDPADVERNLDNPVDDAAFREFEGDPYIVATDVDTGATFPTPTVLPATPRATSTG
jgi:hypothetical protein